MSDRYTKDQRIKRDNVANTIKNIGINPWCPASNFQVCPLNVNGQLPAGLT